MRREIVSENEFSLEILNSFLKKDTTDYLTAYVNLKELNRSKRQGFIDKMLSRMITEKLSEKMEFTRIQPHFEKLYMNYSTSILEKNVELDYNLLNQSLVTKKYDKNINSSRDEDSIGYSHLFWYIIK